MLNLCGNKSGQIPSGRMVKEHCAVAHPVFCGFKYPTNACGYMICKLVDQKGLAAILATSTSAGVPWQVNLRNPLHAGDKVHKWRIQPDFETQGRHHQESKTGISDPIEEDLTNVSPLFLG